MVSMTAIAKYAGVSKTTVSRVLHQPDQVKKETYDKVMAAITEAGYPVGPQKTARKTSRKDTIRLLVSSDSHSHLTDTVSGIIKAADQQGYLVTVHFVTPDKKEAVYEALVAKGTAGVVISSGLVEDLLVEKLNQWDIPFVLLNATHPLADYSVGMDDAEAGYTATSFLLEAGHKKIVWVGGPLTAPENKDRFLGFIHALQLNKSKIRKKRLVVTDTGTTSLYNAFEYLLALKKKPTAIVAATDEIAIQLMNFYLKAGWNVPEDISIIGIGNSDAGSRPDIGLTSVGLKKKDKELGQEAVHLLFDRISQEELEPQHVVKDVSLFERNTTMPK